MNDYCIVSTIQLLKILIIMIESMSTKGVGYENGVKVGENAKSLKNCYRVEL